MIFKSDNNNEIILKCDCTTDCGNTIRFINAYGKIFVCCSSEEFYSRQRNFGFEIKTFFKWIFKKEKPVLFNIYIRNDNEIKLLKDCILKLLKLNASNCNSDFDNVSNYSYIVLEKDKRFGDYDLNIVPNKNFKKIWFLNKHYYKGYSLCLDKDELMEIFK